MGKVGHISTKLPTIDNVITEERILKYANVSGDFNLVHTNRVFAEESIFGGIVAHGMMTLAFISNMLTLHFGLDWLKTGNLSVKFKTPARPGDKLRTYGTIIGDKTIKLGRQLECSVSLLNAVTNEELIAGTATLTITQNKES